MDPKGIELKARDGWRERFRLMVGGWGAWACARLTVRA